MRKIYLNSKRGVIRSVAIGAASLLSSLTLHAQYCTSAPYYTDDSEIDQVVLNGLASSINNNTTSSCAGYSDFTAQSVDLSPGSNYTVSVTLGTCGGNYDKYGKVYIDFNQDGDFTDTGEELGSMGPIYSPAQSSISFQVPITATAGATRMRVVCSEESNASYVYSCGSYYYGETEDYTVNILVPVTDDAALSAIVSPTTSCSIENEAVEVEISNVGTNAINDLYVSYQVNSGTIHTDTLTNLALASTSTYSHTFSDSTDFSMPGSYTIEAWVSYSLDQVSANDSMTSTITRIEAIEQFPYLEDFENGPQAYTTGGTNSSWEFGEPNNTYISAAASGDSAWVTNLTGNYSSGENSYVESPCFNLSSYTIDPSIRFSLIANSEEWYDGMRLEYSTDAGQTWTMLGNATSGTSNWYNDTYYLWWSDDIGSGTNWVDAEHVLTGLAGESDVKLRWTFEADSWVNYEGVGFDDVTISTYPEFSFGADDTLCIDTLFDFTLGSSNSYAWELNGQYASNDSAYFFSDSLQTTATLSLEVTNSVGFSSYDEVTYYYVPPVNLGGDVAICEGSSVTLDATIYDINGPMFTVDYLWNDNSNSAVKTASVEDYYSVILTDNASGCVSSDTAYVTVNALPIVDLGKDTAICEDETLILNPGLWESYSWNSGVTNSGQVTADSSGIYMVVVTDVNGCEGSDDIIVQVNPNPVIEIGNDTAVGAGYVFNLDAGNGYSSYLWSNNTAGDTTSIVATSPQVIFVRVVDNNGCEGYDEFRVDILYSTPEYINTEALNLYPNPVSSVANLQFELNQSSDVELLLTDVQGRVIERSVKTMAAGTYNEQIDMSNVSSGIYILTLMVEHEKAAQLRVIKQ